MPGISTLLSSRLRGTTALSRMALCVLTPLVCLALLAISPPAQAQKPPKPVKMKHRVTPEGSRPIVLVFPVDTKGGITDQLGDLVTDVMQSRLQTSEMYRTVYFLRSLPSIQRALNEGSITPDDVRPPFDNNAKVVSLTRKSGYPMLIVGSIDKYEFDPNTRVVSLILSARLIDVTGLKPHILRSVVLPAASAPSANGAEDDIATRLTRDTVEKLMSELLKPVGAGSMTGAGGK